MTANWLKSQPTIQILEEEKEDGIGILYCTKSFLREAANWGQQHKWHVLSFILFFLFQCNGFVKSIYRRFIHVIEITLVFLTLWLRIVNFIVYLINVFARRDFNGTQNTTQRRTFSSLHRSTKLKFRSHYVCNCNTATNYSDLSHSL